MSLSFVFYGIVPETVVIEENLIEQGQTTTSEETLENPTEFQRIQWSKKQISSRIHEVFGNDAKIMIMVSRCESGMNQFYDGIVVKSRTDDVGIFQIHEPKWLLLSQELGYNIYKEEGNILMAKYILDVQGLNAWSASANCWLN